MIRLANYIKLFLPNIFIARFTLHRSKLKILSQDFIIVPLHCGMLEQFSMECDSFDIQVVPQMDIDIQNIIFQIFDGQNLNINALNQFIANRNADQRLVKQILQMQKKIEYLKKQQQDALMASTMHINKNKNEVISESQYIRWTHQECQLFIKGLEEVGSESLTLTKYLQNKGVQKTRRQVISHTQKFYLKLMKIIQSPNFYIKNQRLNMCYSGIQSKLDQIIVQISGPLPVSHKNSQEVLYIMFPLIEASLGSIDVAVTYFVNKCDKYNLSAEQIKYLVKNYKQFI